MIKMKKKIKMPSGAKDKGLAEMFNQMVGAGSINLDIAHPRYKRIGNLCVKIIREFEKFSNHNFFRLQDDFARERDEIIEFCKQCRRYIKESFAISFSDAKENSEEFSSVYEKVKKSKMINLFIKMCDNLINYKKNFIPQKNATEPFTYNYKFILFMPGIEWKPFPMTNLNIKYVFSLPIVIDDKRAIKFFMVFMRKCFELSYELYNEIQSPDIDVDEFVEVIMSNIDEIQKQPKLHRCAKAFNKIKESVSLLKGNFGDYYRDFIATKDSTIIMQHFIIDVSKNTDADPQLTAQFRTIIQYYQQMAQEQIKNPQIKALFDKVNDSFKEIEKNTSNIVNVKEEEKTTPQQPKQQSKQQPKQQKPNITHNVEEIMKEINLIDKNKKQKKSQR